MSRADRREVWTFCNTFMRINRMLVDYKVRRAVSQADMCVCAQTNHCPSGFNSQRNLLLHEIDHASSACKRDSKRCWTRVSWLAGWLGAWIDCVCVACCVRRA